MDQLGGGIGFTVNVDRQEEIAGTRLGLKAAPGRERLKRYAAPALALVFALLVMNAGVTDGDDLGEALRTTSPIWSVALVFGCLATDRVRARLLVSERQRVTPMDGTVTCRFDGDGYEWRSGELAVRYGWTTFARVIEGERHLALLVSAGRVVPVRAEQLSDTERAVIRRWAEAAPGQRTWEVRRSPRGHSRLRATESPTGDPTPEPATG
jgi:hypothetical protein